MWGIRTEGQFDLVFRIQKAGFEGVVGGPSGGDGEHLFPDTLESKSWLEKDSLSLLQNC